jgi:hypothetical protein
MTSAQLDPTATASLATVANAVGLRAPPPPAYDLRAPSPILLLLYFLMINIGLRLLATVPELLSWPSLGGRGGGFGCTPLQTSARGTLILVLHGIWPWSMIFYLMSLPWTSHRRFVSYGIWTWSRILYLLPLHWTSLLRLSLRNTQLTAYGHGTGDTLSHVAPLA